MSSSFRFAECACRAFWGRIAQAVSVQAPSFGVFRWLYGLFSLAVEAPNFSFIDAAPRAFFDPPVLSLAFLFDGFPPPPFFRVLDLSSVFALSLVTIGYRTRTATLTLCGLRFIGSSFHFSFGKIDHDILSLAVLPCMVLADWGRYYSLDARRRSDEPRGVPRGPALFAVLLAFGMFSAGFPKVRAWIDFDLHTSGLLSWYFPQVVALDRGHMLAPYVSMFPAWLLEAGDYLGALLEVSAFLALLHSRRAWLGWLLLASGFHLANVLLLNINFASYAVLYCCFADLTRLGGTLQRFWPGWVALVGVMASFHLFTRAFFIGAPVLFASGNAQTEIVALWSAIPVVLLAIFLLGRTAVAYASNRL